MEAATVDPDSGEGVGDSRPASGRVRARVRACSSVTPKTPSERPYVHARRRSRAAGQGSNNVPAPHQANSASSSSPLPLHPCFAFASPWCRALARQPGGLATAVPGKERGARASCSARVAGRRRSSMHRAAGLRDRACRALRTSRSPSRGAAARGLPRLGLLSWRAPGVVPPLGEQRVRVAAGHLFLRAPPRDYTRGGVRDCFRGSRCRAGD